MKIIQEPSDKDSFGHLLWQGFGGDGLKADKVAALLGISERSLGPVFHGHRTLTQSWVKEKQVGALIAEHFPENWTPAYAKAFKLAVHGLRRNRGPKDREPDDKHRFKIVWHILGGKEADLIEAPLRLGVSSARLSKIFHGEQVPSRAWMDKHGWMTALPKYYPEGWQALAPVMQLTYESLREDKFSPKYMPPTEWFRLAGKVMTGVAERRGDTPDILADHTRDQTVARQWPVILAGRPLQKSVYLSAMKEMCGHLYHLAEGQPVDRASNALLHFLQKTAKHSFAVPKRRKPPSAQPA